MKPESYEDDMDNIMYMVGNYLYNLLKPEVSGDLDMFKYILGKICIDQMMKNNEFI